MHLPLLLIFVSLAHPQDKVDTDFKPSVDLPVVRNTAGRFQAMNGMCNGIDELAQTYYRYRKAHKNAPGLKDVTDLVLKQQSGGPKYLKQLLETATYKSLAQGNPEAHMNEGQDNPDKFAEDVVAKMKATNEPQSIGLGGDINHRVTVYGAEKVNGKWVLKIADPNHVGTEADNVRLVYDTREKTWRSQINGQPAETWRGAGVIKTPIEKPNEYIELMTMGLTGTKINQIREKLNVDLVPSPVDTPKKSAMIQNDPKAGGVTIQFDPQLFTTSVDEAQLAEMERRTREFLASGQPGAMILRPEARTEHFTLVPLASLKPDGDLGGLTRVLGFVRKSDGTILIAGKREPGAPPIPADFLAVGLQSVYAEGLTPFISLDPDPGIVSGPQHVRIGQIPAGLMKTGFVKTMLDADYEMKRINLGKESPDLPGFRRWVDLMGVANTAGRMRMWLSPFAMAAGDSYVYRNEGSLAVLFESQVRVQSEQEKLASEGVKEVAVDEATEEAARQFTLHYDELANRYRDLSRLRGVFDVTKLCLAWRTLKISGPELAPWLAYKPKAVEIPTSYPGIGPELSQDGKYLITGGAIAKARFRPGGMVETASLAPMLAGAQETTVVLPATLQVSETALATFQAQTELTRAEKNIRDGVPDEALACADRILAFDPNDDEARLVHAVALISLNRSKDALPDLDRLVADNPRVIGIRAGARAEAGDLAGALADANQASSQFPDDEGVLALCVLTRMAALEFDGASLNLSALRLLAPGHPLVPILDQQISLLRTLSPARARERLRMIHEIPPEIQRALLQGAGENIDSLWKALSQLEAGQYVTPPDLYVPERLRFGIAMRLMGRGASVDPNIVSAALDGAQKLIADHPDWPSGYLARAMLRRAQGAPASEVAEGLRKGAALEEKGDPMLDEIKAVYRIQSFASVMAALLWVDGSTSAEQTPTYRDLIHDLEKDAAGRQFIDALAAETKFDAKAFLATFGETGFGGDKAALFATLDRITTGVDKIDPGDAVFQMAFTLSAIPCGLKFDDSPGYWRVLDRALSMAKGGGRTKLLEELSNSIRGTTWMAAGGAVLQRQFAPGSAFLKSAQALSAKLTRLSKPESKGDSLVSVRKTLSDAAVQTTALIEGARREVAAMLAAIRTKHGAATADRVTFCISMLQAFMHLGEGGKFEELAKYHPGVEKSAEYAALRKSYSSMDHLVLDATPQACWPAVLKGIRTRSDGFSVCELLKALGNGGRGDQTLVQTYTAQARAQAEFGVLESAGG